MESTPQPARPEVTVPAALGKMVIVKIGDRGVVRRAAGTRDGRRVFTDVLGKLLDDGDGLTVRRDTGETVTVPAAEVVAAKAIPPKPTSYRAIGAVERACADSWPAPQTRWLGGWLLRACQGWTLRANSVLALGDPGLDLDAALAEVTRWYADRGLPPRFALPLPLSKRLAATLTERGWQPVNTVAVLTAPLAALGAAGAPPVDIDDQPGAAGPPPIDVDHEPGAAG
ncbi:MAG: GNAT family N-acetyltransferase, cg3035/Rv0428c family, partial [Stackebrandtia sp.]